MDQFIRSEFLLGKENINKLKSCCVTIFGLGGVGSYVVEGLARMGIGEFILVDKDSVDLSNLNRQIIATHDTIGQDKVDIAKNRILSINPNAKVSVHKVFYLGNNEESLMKNSNYVVDAIDTVTAKLSLVDYCYKNKIPVISCMGTGNKLDPTSFMVSDIYKTSTCPFCRVMRRELKARNIPALKVVYSTETPLKPNIPTKPSINPEAHVKQTPGSVSFVPSVAGLIIAGEVIKDLLNIS